MVEYCEFNSPNRFICRGPGGLVSEFLVSPQIGDEGTTAGPAAGKCPTSGSQDSPDRAKGHFGSKTYKTVTALKMEFSVLESLSGPQEGNFSLFRNPQLNSLEKYITNTNVLKFFPLHTPIGPCWAYGCLGQSLH